MIYSGRGVLDLWRIMEEQKLNKYVSVDRDAAIRYAQELKAAGKKLEHWHIPGVTPEDDLAFARSKIVESAINYCYWLPDNVNEKFTVANPVDLDRPFRGALAMSHCFNRALGEIPVLSYHLKRHFATLEKTKEFFKGIIPMPLIENRFWNLREVIDVLDKDFQGDPLYIYEEAGWDAIKLVNLLARKLPGSFGSDVSRIYFEKPIGFIAPEEESVLANSSDDYLSHGEMSFAGKIHGSAFQRTEICEAEIRFYKKAKLVSLLYQGRALEKGSRLKKLSSMNEVLAIEDYQAPKVPRHKGVLVYSDELSEDIAQRRIIHRHSRKEVEIRLSLSPANFYILEELNQGLDPDHPDRWDILPLDFREWWDSRGIKTPHNLTPGEGY